MITSRSTPADTAGTSAAKHGTSVRTLLRVGMMTLITAALPRGSSAI